MARIRIPKPFKQLWQEIQPEQLFSLLEKYRATDNQGRYLHWHEFQWRVEKGDDPSAAWLATKYARASMARKLSLLDAEKDQVFQYCLPNSLLAKLHRIDSRTGGGQHISQSLSDNDKNLYLLNNLIQEESISSAQLEGASTTRKVAKEMLEKGLSPQDKSQQMILNNYFLMKKAVKKKDEILSIDLILELHYIATRNAIENNAIPGELRKNNDIFISDFYGETIFQPPDWQTLPDRLSNLCEFANTDHSQGDNFIHPLIKAIILHFMIAYIHPFGDGNGRTARAIFYWSILRSGYWLFEYISISKLIQEKRSDYDKAFIFTETDDFDLTYFIYNQIQVIEKAIEALDDHLEQKKHEFYQFMDWIQKSPIARKLKREQLEILKDAIKSPGREFTVKQVANSLGVTENTARSYLNKLVDKELLVQAKNKAGKTLIYLAPANLKMRLKLE